VNTSSTVQATHNKLLLPFQVYFLSRSTPVFSPDVFSRVRSLLPSLYLLVLDFSSFFVFVVVLDFVLVSAFVFLERIGVQDCRSTAEIGAQEIV
jgi:hypothetical protein